MKDFTTKATTDLPEICWDEEGVGLGIIVDDHEVMEAKFVFGIGINGCNYMGVGLFIDNNLTEVNEITLHDGQIEY